MSTSPYEPKPVPPTGHGVTLQTLRKAARNGEPFACLTCYDATTAKWMERAGIPVLLVGDTAAEMILGQPGTIHAPLEFMLMITAAVKRGAPNTFVMGDMPFGSYQCDDADAVRNAMRFLTEGRADAVKLEVDGDWTPLVAKLSRAGIPVVAHLGSRPQCETGRRLPLCWSDGWRRCRPSSTTRSRWKAAAQDCSCSKRYPTKSPPPWLRPRPFP